MVLVTLACGRQHTADQTGYVRMTGTTQVLAAGTRSETVVFEDIDTGERFALVGELARELVPRYGVPVSVTVVPTEEGWSVDPELQKMKLIEYAILTTDEDYYE
ncbi:MAG: hypothetical protein AVO35_09160 [Candidatus Aegiribacteria sp. MLS_C]|nr:MAG: hypothetical protein AVO35_09160 [Candidatus Aegiribacteria sp. MLS_C]